MVESLRIALGVAAAGALGLFMLRCSDAPAANDEGAGGTGVLDGAGGTDVAGTGAGPNLEGTGGASSTGGTCPEPDLEVTAQVVDPTVLTGEQAPAPTGGTIADGVYDVTSSLFYGDIDLSTLEGGFRQTMRFRGGVLDIARISSNSPDGAYSTYAITSDGTMLHLEAVCPADIAGSQDAWAYSAFPDRLESYAEYTGATAIVTYTKRP